MKVVVNNKGGLCVVYWTGRTGVLTVSHVTYCGETLDAAKNGALQVPDDVEANACCEDAVREKRYPKLR